ncbi:phage neck protein fibritin [Helicobacter pylori]|nr:phage neck protein fibritin [Helicobacter pylori]
MGSFFSLGKSSNDTQENPKDAQKKEEALKKVQEENAELNSKITGLSTEKDKLERESKNLTTEKENLTKDKAELQKQVKALQDSKQVLENVKTDLTNENTKLKNEKTELTNKITGLATEKDNLTKDKENLTKDLSTAKTQAEQTSQKLKELEQRHAPYQKLEKLYEVFLEVKDRLNFNFVATTHSAMDLIASVLSDSKYYLESLYNKASQELSDKRSDKGEKLAELFDLLFEYIKDSKFERLKEPSAYDHSCKTLYPEQNTSQKMQRVVLRGYKHNDKVYYTIVDMGS